MTEQATIPIDAIDPVPETKPRKRGNGKALAVAREAPAPAPVSEGDAFMMMIERAARDPSVDIDKMERLMSMSERRQTREAEAAYNAAMAACQAELIPVARNLENKQTGSKYADLAAIAKVALPIIHRHGFGIICSEFQSAKPDHLGIACKVTHAAGHSERHEFNIPFAGAGLRGNANMTPTHAYATTVSYGRRYAECCVFNIATEDNDGNDGSPKGQKPAERITEKQLADLNALIQKTAEPAANVQIIFQHYKIDNLSDLTPKQFAECVGQLNLAIKGGQ